MSYSTKRSAGERVLESRHVIGLFLGVILLSGVFFTLGYVMGRNQSEAQVSAADLPEKPERLVVSKPDVAPKRANKPTPTPAESPADTGAPASSEWEFYHAGEKSKTEDRLKPAPSAPPALKSEPVAVRATAPSRATNANSKPSAAQPQPWGGYTLQVAALSKEADALELARQLQKKKFPAYVASPHGSRYFRVLVGPYGDQKSVEAARKGLEDAGFKAFVKH